MAMMTTSTTRPNSKRTTTAATTATTNLKKKTEQRTCRMRYIQIGLVVAILLSVAFQFHHAESHMTTITMMMDEPRSSSKHKKAKNDPLCLLGFVQKRQEQRNGVVRKHFTVDDFSRFEHLKLDAAANPKQERSNKKATLSDSAVADFPPSKSDASNRNPNPTKHRSKIKKNFSDSAQVATGGGGGGDATTPRRRRNRLILHVGLPKTATTHLQCALCGGNAERTASLLRQDRLVYLGTCPGECQNDDDQFLDHAYASFFKHGTAIRTREPAGNPLGAFPHALDPHRVANTTTTTATASDANNNQDDEIVVSRDLLRRLSKLHAKQLNVLIIFEGLDALSQRHIAALSNALSKDADWDIQVVVAYRPLHEWLPSKYNSVMKRNRAARIWPVQFFRTKYGSHAKIYGEPLQPFALDNRSAGHSPDFQRGPQDDNLFGEFVHDIEHVYQRHPAHATFDNYHAYFPKPKLWIITHAAATTPESDALLEHFFCQLLSQQEEEDQQQPTTLFFPRVCQEVRQGHIGPEDQSETVNPSAEMNYDMLAIHAYQEGLIDVFRDDDDDDDDDDDGKWKPSRSDVTKALRRHVEEDLHQTGRDFKHHVCLDQPTLERLERLSWKLEQTLLKSALNGDQKFPETEYQRLHQQSFAKALASKKYCSIDAAATLQDPKWRQWFLQNYKVVGEQSQNSIQEQKREEEQEEKEGMGSQKGDNRPLFILHVGLPKTATTHLQCALCGEAPVTEHILLRDNLVYLGTCPDECLNGENSDGGHQFLSHEHQSFFPVVEDPDFEYFKAFPVEQKGNPLGAFPHVLDPDRVAPVDPDNVPSLDPEFVKEVEKLRNEGRSVMVVFEGCDVWSQKHIHSLSLFLNEARWNVHVVVAYRPLYDWLPSKYNSVMKPPRNQAALYWPGTLYKDGVAGEEILPFGLDHRSAGHAPMLRRNQSDVTGFSDYVYEIEHVYHMHPAHMVLLNYQQYFQNVHVMSVPHLYHEQSHGYIRTDSDFLLEFLFCRMLPGRLPHVCRRTRKGNIGRGDESLSSTVNPSVELNYDMLAVQAYKDGLIQVNLTRTAQRPWREDVVRRIQKRQEKGKALTGKDFPKMCLEASTLHRLETLSWEIEQRLFFGVGKEQQHGGNNNSSTSKTFLGRDGRIVPATGTMEQQHKANEMMAVFENLHRTGFARAVEKGKYCSINATQTLQRNGGWRRWFIRNYYPQLLSK